MNENRYIVSGTSRTRMDEVEPFHIEVASISSRHAFVQVCDDLYNHGRKEVEVLAIKMTCSYCGLPHITVPQSSYIE